MKRFKTGMNIPPLPMGNNRMSPHETGMESGPA